MVAETTCSVKREYKNVLCSVLRETDAMRPVNASRNSNVRAEVIAADVTAFSMTHATQHGNVPPAP